MTFLFDLAAAFFISVNVQTLRARLVSAIVAGSAVSLVATYISSILYQEAVSSAESIGFVIGGMIGNSFLTAFAMWLFSKSK